MANSVYLLSLVVYSGKLEVLWVISLKKLKKPISNALGPSKQTKPACKISAKKPKLVFYATVSYLKGISTP